MSASEQRLRHRAEEALELRAQGLLHREIAERMGISRSLAGALVDDPTGEKMRARKDSYRGRCEVCGKPTTGSRGPGKGPQRCVAHNWEGRRMWTRETVIDAIQEYAERYGRQPTAQEWNPNMALSNYRDDLAERFYADDCWPGSSIVQRVFGTWNAAITAAGFTPLESGHKHVDRERASCP